MAPIKEGFRGYCNHGEFDGKRVPVPIQNMILRDYTSKRGLLFKLSVNEFNFPDCHIQFINMLKQLPSLEGIVMCSLFMLPKSQEVRLEAYDAFLRAGAELHMILENVVIRDAADIQHVEDLIHISQTLKSCPKTMPDDLRSAFPMVRFFA